MKRLTAIIIILCLALTGSMTGLPQKIVTGEDSAAYAASYPALKTITYNATGNQRNDVVGFAKTQIGYAEKGNNITYFGYWYGFYGSWCAMFVSWCAAKSGVPTSIVPRIATADRSWAKKQGVYYKSAQWKGSYMPKKGDLIYFSWSVKDYADHIGIVSGTGKVNGKTMVYTIEGNKHDKVCECSYAIDNKYILGYASPKYNSTVAVDPAAPTINAIKALCSEADPAGSVFSVLKLTSSKQSKNSITIKYQRPVGAAKFLVFGSKCGAGKHYQLLKTTTNTSLTIKKIGGKKLKKKTYYRFVVVALDGSGKVLSISRAIHVATKGGKVGNPKKVTRLTPKNADLSMAVGKTYATKFKQVKPSGKKIKKHHGLYYVSTNSSIAAVSGSGIITAKAPGTCYIFAFAQNGKYAYVKVTVKGSPATTAPSTTTTTTQPTAVQQQSAVEEDPLTAEPFDETTPTSSEDSAVVSD